MNKRELRFIQARVARNRRADIHQLTEMSERRRQEEEVILKERERAIEEKLQKAYAKVLQDKLWTSNWGIFNCFCQFIML